MSADVSMPVQPLHGSPDEVPEPRNVASFCCVKREKEGKREKEREKIKAVISVESLASNAKKNTHPVECVFSTLVWLVKKKHEIHFFVHL